MRDDNTPIPSDDLLRAAALRLTEASPAFVGFWLARHRRHHGLTERQLVDQLGTKSHRLPLLALCSTPRPDHFEADVRAITDKFGASPTALAAVISVEQVRYVASAETVSCQAAPTAEDAPLPT